MRIRILPPISEIIILIIVILLGIGIVSAIRHTFPKYGTQFYFDGIDKLTPQERERLFIELDDDRQEEIYLNE